MSYKNSMIIAYSETIVLPTLTGLPSVTPVWIFLFKINHTSLTYLHGKRPISHYATVWGLFEFVKCPINLCGNSNECNLNEISWVSFEYGVSTYPLSIFFKKFDFASFSVEPWCLEHSRFSTPYGDVITKTITKTHRERTSCNTLEYSSNTQNIPRH